MVITSGGLAYKRRPL